MHKNKRENNTSILMLQVKEIEGLIQYLKSLRTNLIHWYNSIFKKFEDKFNPLV